MTIFIVPLRRVALLLHVNNWRWSESSFRIRLMSISHPVLMWSIIHYRRFRTCSRLSHHSVSLEIDNRWFETFYIIWERTPYKVVDKLKDWFFPFDAKYASGGHKRVYWSDKPRSSKFSFPMRIQDSFLTLIRFVGKNSKYKIQIIQIWEIQKFKIFE